MKIEINSYDPAHATINNLLYDQECDVITKFLGPYLNFPSGQMSSGSKKLLDNEKVNYFYVVRHSFNVETQFSK